MTLLAVACLTRDVETGQFQHTHTIRPKCDIETGYYAQSDYKSTALPNGSILTYHWSGQDFQLWQENTCILSWSWKTNMFPRHDKNHPYIDCPNNGFREGFAIETVLALSDDDLLIHEKRRHLCLFNLRTMKIEPLDIGKIEAYKVTLLENQKVAIISTAQDAYKHMKAYNHISVSVLDFTNLLRQEKESQLTASP